MSRQPPLRSLSLFLLRTGIRSWDEVIRADQQVSRHPTRTTSPIQGLLLAKKGVAKPPWWRDYVAAIVTRTDDLDDLFNSSTSAAFLFQASRRRFALTFGHGRFLLEPGSFEPDFGLRVVLNTVEPNLIKSVDARTIDDLPMHTLRDASRGSAFEDFGLDVSRDLVRAVAGPPRDQTLARNLAGADRIAVSTRAQLADLPSLCSWLLKGYRSKEYKDRYPWVDQLRPVKDPALIEELNAQLVVDLRERELDFVHLAPPEPVDPLRLAGFTYSTKREREPDPDPRISIYLESFGAEAKITVDRLKNDTISAYESEGEQLLGKWSVFRCIVYEAIRGAALFVLSAGDWFRVSREFRDETIEFVEGLPRLDVGLPDATRGMHERDYNEKAAPAVDCLNLDRKPVPVPGQRGGVELCDLLSRNRQLVHVKPRGDSSTLSHLFAQGRVSAQLLLLDQSFRTAARDLVNGIDSSFTSVLPTTRPGPGDYEVGYVVITRGVQNHPNPLTLPFFSLVNLASAVRELQAFGFRVTVREVREV